MLSIAPRTNSDLITLEVLLRPLTAEVQDHRSSLLDHLESFPPHLRELAKGHFVDRLARAGKRPMLGEYVPFLIGEVIQSSRASVNSFAIPWLVLYHHALLVDDIIDRPLRYGAHHAILSGVLLQDSLSLFRNRFAAHPDLWDIFQNYYHQFVLATLPDFHAQVGGINLPAFNDSLNLGRKSALVKFCAATLSLESRGHALCPDEDTAFDSLCAGVQLLDDLTDFHEDYEHHNYSLPLRSAFLWLVSRVRDTTYAETRLTSDELIALVALSGSFSATVELAQQCITTGTERLNISTESNVGRYLAGLLEYSRSTNESLEKLMSQSPSSILAMKCQVGREPGAFSRLVSEAGCDAVWHEMHALVNRASQVSN